MGRFGYTVTPAQRRQEVAEYTRLLEQLDAREAVGLADVLQDLIEQGAVGGEGVETHYLPFYSREAAEAMGVEGERLSALADRLDLSARDYPWVLDLPRARGWVALADRTIEELAARFGANLSVPSAWMKQRETYKRRLRKARQSLGE